MITQTEKAQLIKEFGKDEKDSGSTAVQVALRSKEIDALQGHLLTHKKDFSSQRGLMQKVNDRKTLLKYLKKENEAGYNDVIKRLGIRK